MQFIRKLPSTENRSEVFLLLLFGLAFSGFILFRMHPGTDFTLGKPAQIYFSQATAEGIEIAARTHFYRNTLVVGLLLLVLIYLALSFCSRKSHTRFSHYPDLAVMSVALIFTVFLGTMGISVKLTSELLTATLLLRIAGIFTRNYISSDFRVDEFGLNTALALLLLAATWFVIGGASFAPNIVLWFTLLFVIVLLLRFVLARLFRSVNQNSVILPLFFSIPWCIFLASEYCFWSFKKFGEAASPVPVFFLLIVTFGIVLYFLFLRQQDSPRKQKWLRTWTAGSVLFLFTLVTWYQPVISDTTDLFETANSANAVMRVFRFHEVPVINFVSSHMLSEQWYGYLYSFLFGYRTNLEFLVYGFLNDFIYLCTAYIFLVRIFKNTWTTLFVVCFLPVLNETLFPPIFFSVLVFWAVVRAFKSPSVRNYLLVFFVVTALILWRIDTGVAAVTAGGTVFALLWLWLWQRIAWKQLLAAAGIFSIVSLIGVAVAIMINGKAKTVEQFTLFLHYISAEQAHGYAAIGHTETHQFYITHILMPAGSVMAMLYTVYLLRQIPREKVLFSGYLLLSSLFLFLVFLFNAPRGLVRHGFAENTERFFWSTFIPAVALFILHFVRRPVKRYLPAVWFATVFLFFICLKYFPWVPQQTQLESGIRNAGIFHMKWWSQEREIMSNRFAKSDSLAEASAGRLSATMNTVLTPDQTFFDFSNAPLLYFFANRYVPGFFCQNLQNTVDDEMQLLLIRELPVEKVPMVVYSAVPPNWYDATDGIHNTVRYYLIAEHIHSHYYYFRTENGRAVWLSNHLAGKYPPSKYPCAPPQLTLGFLPAYTAAVLTAHSKNYPVKPISSFSVSADTLLTIPRPVRKCGHVWLSAELGSHSTGARSLQLISSGGDTLTMNFSLKEAENNYFFRLTNNYIWWLPGDLKVRIPKDCEVQRLTFYRDERFEDQE